MKNIQILPDDIRQTDTFKNFSSIQKKINMNRQSRIVIQQAVNYCALNCFDSWERTTQSSYHTKEIVKEILIKKNLLC